LNRTMKPKAVGTLCVVSTCSLLLHFLSAQSQPVRILRPLDKSVVGPGPVEIALVVPLGAGQETILLDGEKLPFPKGPDSPAKNTEKPPRLADGLYHPPALVLVRPLSPGLHEVRFGEAKAQFFVCDDEGKKVPPKDWQRYIPHPPADLKTLTCAACHGLAEDGRFTNMTSAFSLEKPERCFDCHDPNEFSLTHRHRLEPLAFCQMCHDPHGATADHILKMTPEKACTLCHE